ncbi:adenosylhomocysteinase [Streptomyces sp. NBC_00160]|uniref:adenosylhomocysteinase n=1 Tax=Streptomyces sp. NBC_00160 TaxID=2903628 RepID=UPI00224D0432|nr:adenosylhomocysteinase [Streptomyces sp. NBC_00160]MCX5302815.1 adenosylhomocysteinase [Streptomyces sp. NBC_00160]
MDRTDRARLDAYFQQIIKRFPVPRGITSLVVTHLLPERPVFLGALSGVTRIAAVLPKPRSIDQATLEVVRAAHPVHELSRTRFADPVTALHFLEDVAAGQQVVLLDIGGYFAGSLSTLAEKFSGRVLGVVEDTENGHQRYASLDRLPCPVVSVARSPLKEPEDHLVGRSIVFSTEALLRTRGDILTGRQATVIGFGKVGRSIAHTLRAQDLHVTVFDSSPLKQVQAHSQGFRTAESCREAIRDAGLVICATGHAALRKADFAALRNGAYVAAATSPDDELELSSLDGTYSRKSSGDHLTRYERPGHTFHLLADGGAVNFVHGAAVGSFIHLVQGEILAAAASIAKGGAVPGLHEVSTGDRQDIARLWLQHFLS